jgi:hypothetical protein
VVVQAEAGVGKSALAAHLAWTRPCAHHFTRLEGARAPEQARRSLAAQLIGAWDLTAEFAPGDAFPAGVDRPDWLLKVLRAAAARADRVHRRWPLVLVVDGLDEADPPAPGQDTGIPLGLPRSEHLPDGVFVVATSRFGVPMAALHASVSWETITVDGPDNMADMRRYVTGAVTGPTPHHKLVELLTASGVSAQWEVGWVRGWRGGGCSVSSPSPSNRACGSPAHGSPMSFTGGVRPEPARAGSAWGR